MLFVIAVVQALVPVLASTLTVSGNEAFVSYQLYAIPLCFLTILNAILTFNQIGWLSCGGGNRHARTSAVCVRLRKVRCWSLFFGFHVLINFFACVQLRWDYRFYDLIPTTRSYSIPVFLRTLSSQLHIRSASDAVGELRCAGQFAARRQPVQTARRRPRSCNYW